MRWTIGEVLGHTFRSFGKSWLALVGGYALMALVAASPLILWAAVAVLPPLLHGEAPQTIAEGIGGSAMLAGAGSVLLFVLFAPGQVRLALAAARGQETRVAFAFDVHRAGTLFAAALLAGLATMGGTLLLIVPGVIVAIGLALYNFFVVDTTLGPLESLRATWSATRGHRAHLFGFMLLVGLATIFADLVAMFVPGLQLVVSLVSAPLTLVAMATIYDRLRPAPAADAADPLLLGA